MNCQFIGEGTYRCPVRPVLQFRAIDVSNEREVIQIRGTLANINFSCDGKQCDLPIRQTPPNGSDLFFGAVTQMGDEDLPFRAWVRVRAQDPSQPENGPWFVIVLSTQWTPAPLDMCSMEWEALPPVDSLPAWLPPPTTSDELETSGTLDLLAGKLIRWGVVDAQDCPAGGLLLSGGANACGIQLAREAMISAQNRFNKDIFTSARQARVPAVLLKRLVSQETQFWPASQGIAGEFGLGQISELGIDTLLMWSPTFYDLVCPLFLNAYTCQQQYTSLPREQQALLRGAVLQTVDAQCPECPAGVDWDKASDSVPLFAETLRANCIQVGQMVRNVTGRSPGQVTSYVDLWYMTLANYNAGPGCLSRALIQSWEHRRLDWDSVSNELEEGCKGARNYVRRVAP